MKTSVIVLNRDRDTELTRCLLAMSQQFARDFELVVVTNRPDHVPYSDRIKVVPFADANVSAARNAGVACAAGDILAFCDDDAVPEPTWLQNLIRPFSDPTVGGVGGLVRGRNGISLQWGPQEVDCFGNDWPHDGRLRAGHCFKTVGTNCAFRREALESVSGFDESFRYFLDETDLNWRMSQAGWSLVLASDAEVHHSYARNSSRSSQRVPRDLFEIGASKSCFCLRHGTPDKIEAELRGFRAAQADKLHRAMHLGWIEPKNVIPVLETLDHGLETGRHRTPAPARRPKQKSHEFHVFPQGKPPETEFRSHGIFNRQHGRMKAAEGSRSGKIVTLFEHSPTAIMARVWYDNAGYWHHRGGVFGRIERTNPLVTLRRAKTWIEAERKRIETVRIG